MRKLGIVIMIFFTVTACDVLDVRPQNSIPANEAFKDKAGIERGILGSYVPFQYLGYYGRSYLILSDLAADNLDYTDQSTSDYVAVDINNILPANGKVGGIWTSAYEGINNANNVMSKIPGMTDMTDIEKLTALGELRFIRALNHFNLLNYFGAIPVRLTPTIGTDGVNVPREPVNVVYDQIIDDLQFAETNLAKSNVKIRATKYAATALLARVYLYKGDYELAIAKASEVIQNNDYKLLPNYADIFAKDGSDETIFEIDFTELNRNRIAEENFPRALSAKGEVIPNTRLVNAYTTGDERYAASFRLAGTLPYAVKYDDLSVGQDNVIILRLAEMYLIRAEAEARKPTGADIDKIQDDLDVIRLRASLGATTATSIGDLLVQIEQERRLEFAFEGHRWFDLVRTGRATALLPRVTNINKTLFPIPQSETLTNKHPLMTQNPGY